MTHTHTHTLGRTPLDEGSARRRDLYLTTHDIHKKHSHASVGIRTRNPRKRAAADPRLRRRGHRDRPRAVLRANKYHMNFPGVKPGLLRWDTSHCRVSGSIQDIFMAYLCWTKCHISTFFSELLWTSPPNQTIMTLSLRTQLLQRLTLIPPPLTQRALHFDNGVFHTILLRRH
jgi:hypothetical protein